MRMLQPLLKLQLTEARREILNMAYRPQKVWREVEIRKPTGNTERLRTLGDSDIARILARIPGRSNIGKK
jgi:hypothetical protein